MKDNFNNVDYQKQVFLDLISSLKKRKFLEKALFLAEKAHRNQFREEGVPYIIHPIRVAIYIFRDLGITDTDLLIAALLHDVVEDTGIKIKEIKKHFGERLVYLIEGLTRRRPPSETEEEKRESKRKKFEELMESDRAVRIVKCSDLLDNVRSWPFIPKDHPARQKFPRWIEEAKNYYIPLTDKTDKKISLAMRRAISLWLS